MNTLSKETVAKMVEPSWPTPTDLADAAQELEAERVERALEWERAREAVTAKASQLKNCMRHLSCSRVTQGEINTLWNDAEALVLALMELERIEAGGAK